MGEPGSNPEAGKQHLLEIPDPIPATDRVARVNDALGQINGFNIERSLIDLAQIGGLPVEATSEQPRRFATNRLALGEQDLKARSEFIRPLMETAGMEMIEHPFGLVGIMKGRDSKLEPVVALSHTDTVPNGDMYDGTLGVIGGITAAKAIKDAGIKLDRDFIVISLTGEESSRFGFACFGSQSMFLGLSDKEMSARDSGGQTIAEVVGEESAETVKQPIFGPNGSQFPAPHSVIELHVSQDKRLGEQGMDIGVVDAIAAPMRYEVRFGADEPIEPRETDLPYSRYFEFTAQGRADHSGATPMTPGARADGLLATSDFITTVFKSREFKDKLAVADIDIDGQAINKVPGISRTLFRVSGETPEAINEILNALAEKATTYNEATPESNGNHFALEETEKPEGRPFFDQQEVINRQLSALVFVRAVNAMVCDPRLMQENVVGTVGTFKTDENGVINLGLDIRGTDAQSRDEVIKRLMDTFDLLQVFSSIDFGETLAGSGDPVKLDDDLAQTANDTIGKYELGPATTMFSAAGHDAQNAARADIPTVMLFVPSRDGIAHNPDAYTAPAHLEKGVKALTALVIELASKK
jgi:acetylornithine deacetylase/succinyl-diaminopimelate desuccinylase-like protein